MAYNYTDIVFAIKGLSPTDKLVLLHLAEHADKDTGECWPGFGRMAEYTGLTRRSCMRSVTHLATIDLICNHRTGGGKCGCGVDVPPTGRATNTYVLRMDRLVAASTAPVPERTKRKYSKSE